MVFYLAFKGLLLLFYFTKLADDIRKGWISKIYFVSVLSCNFYICLFFFILFSFFREKESKESETFFHEKVLSSCMKFKKYCNFILAPLFWRRRRRRRIFYRRRFLFYRRRSLFYRRRFLFYRRRRSLVYRRRFLFYRRRRRRRFFHRHG